jgi:hypothetical protein
VDNIIKMQNITPQKVEFYILQALYVAGEPNYSLTVGQLQEALTQLVDNNIVDFQIGFNDIPRRPGEEYYARQRLREAIPPLTTETRIGMI